MTYTTQDQTARPAHDVGTLVGIGVVAVAAAVMSFASLMALGQRAGYASWLAILLPVAIDAQAVVATRAWLSARTPESARSYARGLALSAIVLSVVGNAGEHAMQAYSLATPWWVLLGVSAVPPIALAATAHLAAVLAASDDASQSLAESASSTSTTAVSGALFRPPAAAAAATPSARPVPPNPSTTPPPANPAAAVSRSTKKAASKSGKSSASSPKRSDDELRDELAAAIADPEVDVDVSSAESIRKTLGCAPVRARMLRDEHQAIERPHLAVVGIDRA